LLKTLSHTISSWRTTNFDPLRDSRCLSPGCIFRCSGVIRPNFPLLYVQHKIVVVIATFSLGRGLTRWSLFSLAPFVEQLMSPAICFPHIPERKGWRALFDLRSTVSRPSRELMWRLYRSELLFFSHAFFAPTYGTPFPRRFMQRGTFFTLFSPFLCTNSKEDFSTVPALPV